MKKIFIGAVVGSAICYLIALSLSFGIADNKFMMNIWALVNGIGLLIIINSNEEGK